MINRPVFPKSLEQVNIFKNIIEACDQRTEVSKQFLCGGLLTGLASVVGRRVGLEGPQKSKAMYPTTFTILVGESGGSYKSTTLNIINDIIEASDPNVRIERGLATPEGLIRQFALPDNHEHGEEEFVRPKISNGIDKYEPDDEMVEHMLRNTSETEGFRTLFSISEFMSVLHKENSSGNGLIAKLADLYDSPIKLSNPTSGSPVMCYNPHGCLMGALPSNQITKLSESHVTGQLGRRLNFICDSETVPVPFPKPPNANNINNIVSVIGEIRNRYHSETVFELTEGARESFSDWYINEFSVMRKDAEIDELYKTFLQCKNTNIMKTALLLACVDNVSPAGKITNSHMGFAMEWADFIYRCQEYIFNDYVVSEQRKLEDKVYKYLVRKDDWVKLKPIYKSTRTSSEETQKALEGLLNVDKIEIQERNGITFYRAARDA